MRVNWLQVYFKFKLKSVVANDHWSFLYQFKET